MIEHLTQPSPAELDALTALWEASVRATHDFLSEEDIPFFRSYGVNLPSSLTTLLPLALESSSYLPVSVCGTGTSEIHTAFLAIFHLRLRY